MIHKFNNNTDLQQYFSGPNVSERVIIIFRTSYSDCCGNNHSHTGQCFFPNGTRIEATSSDSEVYVTRSEQTVELYFRNVTNMVGIYSCTVANQQGQDQDCHFTLQTTVTDSTSIDRNTPPEIHYNSTDFTLQCKFQGCVSEVQWYLFLSYATNSHINDQRFPLHWGDQYHQSTIQATNLENYYVNELTIINGSAHLGPYICSAVVGSSHYQSTGISICKLKTGNYKN